MRDSEIGDILRRPAFLENRDAEGAAGALLNAALIAGSKRFGPTRDNTTIVVAYL
jgi:hypothetical protein